MRAVVLNGGSVRSQRLRRSTTVSKAAQIVAAPRAPTAARSLPARSAGGFARTKEPDSPTKATVERVRRGHPLWPHPARPDSEVIGDEFRRGFPSIPQYSINRTRGEHHDRYLHLRRLFQPRRLRLPERRQLARLLGQARP